jgi:hypothetical protein
MRRVPSVIPSPTTSSRKRPAARSRVAGHTIHEARLIERTPRLLRELKQHIAAPPRRDRDLPLKILVAIAAKLVGIVEGLPDNLTPGLRIAP